MNSDKLMQLRLSNQQIAETGFKTVKDIFGWMGAIQAQDYNMAKWAIGIRLPGSTDRTIEESIAKGDIIRTHLLRPTWHLVSADDIYWMLELTGPRIKASLRSRHRQLGLTDAIFERSNDIIEKALIGGGYLTRDELMAELRNAKVVTDSSLLSHILMQAELDGIICSGPVRGKKITYSLLRERVPNAKSIPRAEALSRLARRYFTSRGPATLQDFVWWSGLSVTDARYAVGMLGSDFVSEKMDSQTYWSPDNGESSETIEGSVYVLPAFDELLISYKDRSAFFPFDDHGKTVSNNGMFRPFILVDGGVSGVWKRTFKKDRVVIETHFFRSLEESTNYLLEEAFAKYGHFLGRKVEIIEG
ncbi:MAG: winged helix DNA-binding domain-containing protein [Methanolobus sp.]|nr:winged helix DNA-binding domain-containing protein [Methanolobus sp.]